VVVVEVVSGKPALEGDDPTQLRELALAGGLGGPPRLSARQFDRPRLGLQAKLGAEPGGAQQAQRVVGKRAR